MVVVPVDGDMHEAQNVTPEDREQRYERLRIGPLRNPQFQHHDGDDDRDHAVAERLEPPLPHHRILRLLPAVRNFEVIHRLLLFCSFATTASTSFIWAAASGFSLTAPLLLNQKVNGPAALIRRRPIISTTRRSGLRCSPFPQKT